MFLITKMSQDAVYGVLVLNPPVRRIGDDSDRSATVAADLNLDTEHTF